jgi:hypothetical protein
VREEVEKISSPEYSQNLVRYEGKPPAHPLKHYLANRLNRILGRKRSTGPQVHDPQTLLHIGHIRHGGIGHGMSTLNAAQQRCIADLVREKGPFE